MLSPTLAKTPARFPSVRPVAKMARRRIFWAALMRGTMGILTTVWGVEVRVTLRARVAGRVGVRVLVRVAVVRVGVRVRVRVLLEVTVRERVMLPECVVTVRVAVGEAAMGVMVDVSLLVLA